MNEKLPVSFPGWKGVLALSDLTPVVKASHTREILTFLHHCKKTHSPVTVVLIKQWLADRETAAHGPAHLALRWFYREAPKVVSDQGRGGERNPRATGDAAMPAERPPGPPVGRNGVHAPPDAASVLGTSRSTSPSRTYNHPHRAGADGTR